jgi:hypothetical protein
MGSAGRFCLIWLISLLATIGLAGLINYEIDPYDVYGSARMPGVNQFKAQAKNHMMLAKSYQVNRVRPTTVLLGSSRVLIGLDAQSASWPAYMCPVYNFGVPGSSSTSQFESLQETYWTGHLKYVVAVLDFENFVQEDQVRRPLSEDQRRLHTLEDGRPNVYRSRQLFADSLLTLFTLGALEDSLATVLAQTREPTLDLRPDGSANEAEFIRAVTVDGYRVLFDQKESDVRKREPDLVRKLSNIRQKMPNLDQVAKMIEFCRERGVALALVIPPTHVDTLEIYWADGLWPRVEQWKTELAGLVQSEGGGLVSLWDFEAYDQYATEARPKANDFQSATKWFWEPSHFKKTLGELMLKRMFGDGSSDFGVQLTLTNVASRNAFVREQRFAYHCTRGGTQSLPAARNGDCWTADSHMRLDRTLN